MKTEERKRECLRGIAATPGVASGEIYLYDAYHPQIERQFSEDAEAELARYAGARDGAERELRAIAESLLPGAPDKAAIFTAHIDLLLDEEIEERVCACIREEKNTAEFAVRSAYDRCAALFERMDDPLIRERRADVADVSLRLLRVLEGRPERNLSTLPRPVIIAAHDLLPSDTATLDRQNTLGILTEVGNVTSHTAIIARNYGIPAILSIPGLTKRVRDGLRVVMDGEAGAVYLDPDPELLRGLEAKKREQEADRLADQAYLKRKLETADHVRVLIGANIGSPAKRLADEAADVDCVGLFRTEFLYMESVRLPTEEEQFEVYRSVLRTYGEKPVLLRTIDIGGDKSIPALPLPKEDNPFLGVRALRLCYERPDLFKTQLRAALRASAFGRLEIMFPMVSGMDDIYWAREMLREAGGELDSQGLPWDRGVRVGVMMEVPSILLIADRVAREVDFASVGTNDLCQYLTASDRLNPGTARYYQSFHPAMFRLIGDAAKRFAQQGKQLGVCGELGGDPLAAPVLVGLGVRKLSMNHASVARIKHELSGMTAAAMEALAARVLDCGTEAEVLRTIRETLKASEERRYSDGSKTGGRGE